MSPAPDGSAMMTDLKLLDELLIDYKTARGLNFADLEGGHGSNLTVRIMRRLREAWQGGEMEAITLALADYFESGRNA